MLVPLVLVLALHAADKNEAEQQFQQMEMKLANAKTLDCTLEGKMEGQEKGEKKAFTVKGLLAFADGNKARLEMSGDMDGKAMKIVMISDGTKMLSSVEGRAQEKQDTPKELNENGRVMFARAGLLLPFFSATAKSPGEKEPKVDDLFKVSGFKLGKKEKIGDQEAQAIHYTLTMKGSKEPVATTVWLDTKTHLPLKRELSSKTGDDKFTVTETYTKLKLDEKIDPKMFELPKE